MPEVTNFVEVARGASGYQKKEFAEFLEVDPQTYRKIESDPDNMTPWHGEVIAAKVEPL